MGVIGFGEGRFTTATGIATDFSDNVYVADNGSPETTVQKFTNNGTFLTAWGTAGLGDGQFLCPGGVTVDSSDNVYVSDFSENNRIQKFDSNGNFLGEWGTTGSGDGAVHKPSARHCSRLYLDNIYVADWGNNRIQKFDSNGNFITKWGTSGAKMDNLEVQQGSGGRFWKYFVADTGITVSKSLTATGNLLRNGEPKGQVMDSSMEPTGIAIRFIRECICGRLR